MTKHDFQAALDAAEGAFQGYRYMGQDAEVHMEALRYLTRLAAIVTGEPSEESRDSFLREWSDKEKRGTWTKSMMFTSAYKKLREQQIAEAQREAEGV